MMKSFPIIENGGIVVEEGVIVDVGDYDELSQKYHLATPALKRKITIDSNSSFCGLSYSYLLGRVIEARIML